MKTNFYRRTSRAGYTLLEVAVASTILMIGVGAACVLSLTMSKQEESHQRVARAINQLENAVALYQLGFTPTEAMNLLPDDPMRVSGGFTATAETNVAMTGIGAPQMTQFSMDI